MTAVQRTASGLLRLAIGRRRRAAKAPRDARKIHVLLMNAYGMGGTIRTTLNLVEELAETHEVELISVLRRRERPLFPFPEGIEVSSVDDRRRSAQEESPPGWLARRLKTSPQSPRPPRGLGIRRLERVERRAAHPQVAIP